MYRLYHTHYATHATDGATRDSFVRSRAPTRGCIDGAKSPVADVGCMQALLARLTLCILPRRVGETARVTPRGLTQLPKGGTGLASRRSRCPQCLKPPQLLPPRRRFLGQNCYASQLPASWPRRRERPALPCPQGRAHAARRRCACAPLLAAAAARWPPRRSPPRQSLAQQLWENV